MKLLLENSVISSASQSGLCRAHDIRLQTDRVGNIFSFTMGFTNQWVMSQWQRSSFISKLCFPWLSKEIDTRMGNIASKWYPFFKEIQ